MGVHTFRLRPLPLRAALALSAAALIAAGCSKEEPVVEVPVVRAVKLLTVGGTSSVDGREYAARVAAVREATVGLEVGGRIAQLPVREGQWVSKGALLARLDARDFKAQLAAARADRAAAEADYLRFQELLEQDAVSRREFETRERNFEVAKSRLEVAEKDLEDAELRAPFSGLVARKLVDDYENVEAKQPILLLQDASALEIEVDLPEADLHRVRGADARARLAELDVTVSISSTPGTSFPAKLKELATTADPATQTFLATFAFEPSEKDLVLPGMTARVTLAPPARAGAGLNIPSGAAVADESGKPYVWKVDEASMAVSKAPVTLGELSGADVAVTSGLAVGDVIAVSGVHHLRNGMEVKRFEG
jgi:RND family efflux transporter MFP subunit